MKLLITLLLFSCATTQEDHKQKLDPAVYYKNDMCLKSRQGSFCGVGVLEQDENVRVRIDAFNKLDKFVLTTCHREIDTDKPDKGLFRENGVINLNLKQTIEKNKACPFYFGAFNKKGKHAWGIAVMKSDKYQLEATLNCNGDIEQITGVGICQSREGLIQKITFKEPVKITKPVNGPAQRKADCPEIITSYNDKVVEFKMPNRECLYGFIGKESKKLMQFYTIGYEQLITR